MFELDSLLKGTSVNVKSRFTLQLWVISALNTKTRECWPTGQNLVSDCVSTRRKKLVPAESQRDDSPNANDKLNIDEMRNDASQRGAALSRLLLLSVWVNRCVLH